MVLYNNDKNNQLILSQYKSIIKYISKMQIDFNSLSFKIPKPELDHLHSNNVSQQKIKVKQYLGFEDTQASGYEQQTTSNPFRRTFHLFKHVENEKRNSQQKSFRAGKSPTLQPLHSFQEANQTIFSLSNFDSFKNMDSKGDTLQSIAKHLYESKPTQPISQISEKKISNNNDYIKIESSFQHPYQNSSQFSLIMDDLNCQLKSQDLLIPDNTRRIKTEYYEDEKIQKKKKKSTSGIFCLTAQQQSSSQSHVQQFYFDLRKEKQKIKTQQQSYEIPCSLKKQIKNVIYNFIDDLEIMEDQEIDPDFVRKVQECLVSVKKIPNLLICKTEITPEKWNKSNRKSIGSNSQISCRKSEINQTMKRQQVGQPSQKPILNRDTKNKQNTTPIKQNSVQYKNKGTDNNIYKVMQYKAFHKDEKKKKWIL